MKTLIVEDDLTCRMVLQGILKPYGPVDLAENGKEALVLVRRALESLESYDLICMDIMMPEMDGHEAVAGIRDMEEDFGIPKSQEAKVVMTTALDDSRNVTSAYVNLCDLYVVKPIHKEPFLAELRRLGLLDS